MMMMMMDNQSINNITWTKPMNGSPKKIMMQKYHADLEASMTRDYSSRLFLTWIYRNTVPPQLAPLPRLGIQQRVVVPQQHGVLLPHSTPLSDVERYVGQLVDMVDTVIHFFYRQHSKRHSLAEDNALYHSLFIGCIYYADLFSRKNTQASTTFLDVLTTSIIVTIKMWMEEKMSVNKYIAKIFNTPIAHINRVEAYFLQLIDYQVYLHEKDLALFIDIIHRSSTQLRSQQEVQQQQQQSASQSSSCIATMSCLNYNPFTSSSASSFSSPMMGSTSSSSSASQPSSPFLHSCMSTPTGGHSQEYSSSPSSLVPTSPNNNNKRKYQVYQQQQQYQQLHSQQLSSTSSHVIYNQLPHQQHQQQQQQQRPIISTTTLVLCSTPSVLPGGPSAFTLCSNSSSSISSYQEPRKRIKEIVSY
ncbi:hypothetical protein SAMD00019534_109220, partial [Acytostelium subglobosum LB1]|uniref:hypothetical protein n=1 Tax=Acytostelium subglobosum LB1 TaxID=1410327 RepID=UPI000644AE51